MANFYKMIAVRNAEHPGAAMLKGWLKRIKGGRLGDDVLESC